MLAIWAPGASSIGVGTAQPFEGQSRQISPADPRARLGDRLFFEARFSQFYFGRCGNDVNRALGGGAAEVDEVEVISRTSLPGPFRGQGINCRQCHLGDDFLPDRPLAGRTYVDFSRRSRVPSRNDGVSRAARNAPSMVDLGLPRPGPFLFHLDGEFVSLEDLTTETLTGRNLGWLPQERATAAAHIARVIRDDNGVNPRHFKYVDGSGIPYRVALLGVDSRIPEPLRLPAEYRLDVAKAGDSEVLAAVARLIDAYTRSLRFGNSNTLRESTSPYDLFLVKNALPTEPMAGESARQYAERLLGLIQQRTSLAWVVPPRDGRFELHRQRYEFGPTELQGLHTFFSRGGASQAIHVGNCVSCHTPPRFTDYSLHNNGVSQAEYDAIFGTGAFAALPVPGLAARARHFEDFLPASPTHPLAFGRFRAAPSAANPGYTDLGAWNVFANPDMPKPQAALKEIFCGPGGPVKGECKPEAVLPLTIAYFKTASVRDLGQSDPYFHSGALDTLEDVVKFYIKTSDLARKGKLRNGSPEISAIRIDATDIVPLTAFLRSLNEDYR